LEIERMPEKSGQETITQELEQACAEEPIHIIGTIQPHGFVLVVDVASTRIVQVSSGVARHWPGLGEPTRLLHAALAEWIDGLEADPSALLGALPDSDPIKLSLQPRASPREARTSGASPLAEEFECIGHRVGGVALLEWVPVGAKSQNGASQTQMIVEMRAALARLRGSNALGVFFGDCVREVARLCGFDRVMIYRFRPDWSGEVVAEHAATRLKTRFVGLRFPASDIPSQARALFGLNKVRVLADILAEPDTLLPPKLPGGVALDQSHSLLRGFSEVHRSYLRNMGVRATMSLSILSEGKLWGLIACHHYEPRVPPHHVRETLQHVCELVADFSALRIESLTQLESAYSAASLDRLLANLQQALMREDDVDVVLERMLPQLLLAFDASAFYLRTGGTLYAGHAMQPMAAGHDVLDEVAVRFEAARLPASTQPGVLHHDNLLVAGGKPLACLPRAAGVLAAQQSADRNEICAFTRPEIAKEVLWAGAPSKHPVSTESGRVRLEPRRSFAQWRETVSGTARAWSPSEVNACARLLQVVGDAGKRRARVKLEGEMQWRAHHDHLTGLYNRRTMEETLDRRMGDGSFDSALMLIDLDHFKAVNDTHGHAVGDRLLQDVSSRLSSVIRPADSLARMGGDEFMLLAKMPLPDDAAAVTIGARLHRALEEPFEVRGQLMRIGVSIGVAIPPGHGINTTDLMRRADLALYRAKKLGRSRTVIFDAQLEAALLGTYEMERDLKEALAKDQLSLVFQPQVNLATGRVVGLEALARWNHPLRGAVGPAVFIPIAERSGLITQIGAWVVRCAAATQANWREQGMSGLPVSVNVSMKDVMSGKLVDNVSRALDEFQLPANSLEIELTESVIMSDLDLTRGVLRGLRQLGVTTSLDDFGTGYSSLSYLRQLPLNSLKVDQSFIAGLTDDAQSRSLTQAIIRMAQALELTTIAEGIETTGQMHWLSTHECNIGQGYLFSHPLPPGQVHGAIERIEAGWSASA
jgi:diguanylate cyclase (GGDEF)-like protein